MKFQRIQDLRTRNIPVEMLIRLANYYDISVDYLVGRTDKKEMNK